MDLDEALSRLIDQDLDADATAAIRHRIAHDAEAAARYGEMLMLVADLDGLPEELPVHKRPFRLWPAAGWVLAAIAALWILWPRPVPVVIQTLGETAYEGVYQVVAGDMTVHIDGWVQVGMEPRTRHVRGGGQEDDMKFITHGAAAAVGAMVTITVSQGTARVWGAQDRVIEVAAGESRSFGGGLSPAAAPSSRAVDTAQDRVVALEAELALVKKALGEERFAKVLVKGQLDAERGIPTDWPEELDVRLAPAGFPGELEALVTDLPGVELVSTDCDEYPCIGALRFTGPADDLEWGRPIGEHIRDWAEDTLGDQVSLAIANIEDRENEEDPKRFLVFSAHGEDRESSVFQRVGRRMEQVGSSLIDVAE